VAYHEEEDDDGDTIRYTAEQKLNTFSEGWKYFCLLLPAHPWKNTSFTVRFYDNIGSLDIDGLQLTKNDVQTMQYDATGRLTSRYCIGRYLGGNYD